MGVQEYPVNACGMRDGLSWDMLVSSRHNLVPSVLTPQWKIASYPPDCHCTFYGYWSTQWTQANHHEIQQMNVKSNVRFEHKAIGLSFYLKLQTRKNNLKSNKLMQSLTQY